VPYRIDIAHAQADVLDQLIDVGALDVATSDHHVSALMPDAVDVDRVKAVLGRDDLRVSPARGRDGDSVWILQPRPVQVGRLQLFPAGWPSSTLGIRLVDDEAFGTGLHPTTALCLEAMDEQLAISTPAGVLDVGTGSGVLALAALFAGVPEATAIDIDADALRVAHGNARANGLEARLRLAHGGPDVVNGMWPLVVANILAAPLIEMAPVLAQRVGHGGRLILSGVHASLMPDVERAYRRPGMRPVSARTRDGWSALTFDASW
jgi:ribosomal protein L11 methyltransferase